MPSTVASLLAAVDLTASGVARWGESPSLDGPGVYVVALDERDDRAVCCLARAPISERRCADLVMLRPGLKIDGDPADADGLVERLSQMWLPDETVLYVGKASRSVRHRVGQYYSTPLGARSPHAGGWFLKMLSSQPARFVHFAASDRAELHERQILAAFIDAASDASRIALIDPDHPYPFANLDGPAGRKSHGISGAKAQVRPSAQPAARGTVSALRTESKFPSPPRPRTETTGESAVSQPITENDIAAGQIRFPGASKGLLPGVPSEVEVSLRGELLPSVRWDPRIRADRDRSGVLRVGREPLERRVAPNEVLAVRRIEDRIVLE